MSVSKVPKWAAAWAASRIQGRPAPPGTPSNVQRAWAKAWPWLTFVEWRLLRHGVPPKPMAVPRPVPPAWWTSVGEVRRLLAASPAPSPPHPSPPHVLDSFALPVLYVTDAGTAARQAKDAHAAGFRSFAVQNTSFSSADVTTVTDLGMQIHMWGIVTPDDANLLWKCQATIYGPQVEGPSQADAAIASLGAGVGKLRHRCIVTNFGGLGDHPDKAAKIIPLTEATAVECYGVELPPPNPQSNLEVMTWQARIYGLPEPFPVVECIRGVGYEIYPQLPEWGHYFGVWRGEQVPEDKFWAQTKTLLEKGVIE